MPSVRPTMALTVPSTMRPVCKVIDTRLPTWTWRSPSDLFSGWHAEELYSGKSGIFKLAGDGAERPQASLLRGFGDARRANGAPGSEEDWLAWKPTRAASVAQSLSV